MVAYGKKNQGRSFMQDYNFKVVAKLREDLTEDEKIAALNEIEDLQGRLKIVNVDNVTYCKAQPIHNYDDFGAVALFFSALKDMQKCFSKLEYYDLWEGNKRIVV